jgi:invasion protein IalB
MAMLSWRSGAVMAHEPFASSRLRSGIASAVAVLLGTAAATTATAEIRKADPLSASWRMDQPMRLGVTDATPRRSEVARQQTPQNNCRKWRRIAERLGETYAGIRLRQSVVDRACLFAATELASVTGGISGTETSFDHLWAWPWADGAIDPALPPRLHATYSDWTIRCGQAGRRERCALIHETVAVSGGVDQTPSSSPSSAKVVTHFVIDTIGGHAHVVWRVFVERSETGWFSAASSTERNGTADLTRADLVQFSSGTISGAKRFDGCSAAGCLMEADMTTSARLATRLWEGQGGELKLEPVPGVTLTAPVSANGVRAGLAELARLKRSEDKVLARN